MNQPSRQTLQILQIQIVISESAKQTNTTNPTNSNGNIRIRQTLQILQIQTQSTKHCRIAMVCADTVNAVTFCGPLLTSTHMRIAMLTRRS